MNRKHILRFASLAVSATMLVASTSFGSASAIDSSLQAEYNKLEAQASELNNKINANKGKAQQTQEDIKNIQASINTTESQIDLLNGKISDLDKQITDLNKQVDKIQKDIEDNYDTFKSRLRSIYMSGGMSELQILLGAKDLGDYLSRVELVKSVSAHDKKLLNSIEDKLAKVQKLNREAEENKKEQEELQAAAEKKRDLLESQYSENKELLQNLNDSISSDKDELAKVNAAKEEQSRKIDAALKKAAAEAAAREAAQNRNNGGGSSGSLPGHQGGATSGTSGGVNYEWGSSTTTDNNHSISFRWPIAGGGTYVSSGYGYRAAFGKFHYGLDISGGGVYGKPVVAAAAGTVVVAGWSNYGFGNYVGILHNSKYSTVYGHMATITVSQGQHVSAGQQVGTVGSTGNSTGPHLHFEVKVNGSNVNPAAYF